MVALLRGTSAKIWTRRKRVLHPLRFFKLEDTAGIIIALVSALMTPSSILSGDSFYADMRDFNEIFMMKVLAHD